MVPVAIVGGGPYAARLCEVLAGWRGIPALELRLHARDRERLRVIAGHAAARVAAVRVRGAVDGDGHAVRVRGAVDGDGHAVRVRGALDGDAAREAHVVRACEALDEALEGAAVVVLLVRVGGLAARDHDEAFPAQFGLVGDEGVGAGGMANAWRTLPVLDEMAARIAACAPRAWVLNMMAPLGVTTRRLIEGGRRAVGLCELPTVTRARWAAAGDAPGLWYAGLNHLGFFWSAELGGEHPVVRAAIAAGDATPALVARLGAAPLHYFVDVFEPAVARALGRPLRGGRARVLVEHNAVLVRRFADEPGAVIAEADRRPTPWFEQALAPALHAVIGGPAFEGPLDLPNGAWLDEAPAAVVIELYGRLTAEAATLEAVPARPPAVRAVLGQLAAAEDLVYRAAVARDRGLLGEALDALPVAVRRDDRERVLDCVCEPIAEAA